MAEHKQTDITKTSKPVKPGKLELIRQKFRHGLVIFSIRNVLASIGIDFSPYYWVLEGHSQLPPPKVKGPEKNYNTVALAAADIDVMNVISGVPVEVLKKKIQEGKKDCIGLRTQKGAIAALMFVEYGDIEQKKRIFKLNSGEAYLSNMYTFHRYRGRNLAPYLRYQCYELLRSKGFHTFYSVTAFWNASSRRFKEKLGARHLSLYLTIVLFRKWYWNFKIRDIEDPQNDKRHQMPAPKYQKGEKL